MSSQPLSNNFDEIFDQALSRSYDGPIPETVLYRLLSAAELVIRRYLSQDNSDKELVGLRVGYTLQEPESNSEVKLYWIGWGYHPAYDKLLEPQQEIFGHTINYANVGITANSFPDQLTRDLVYRLKEEMLRYAPSALLKGKELYPFVFGHASELAPISHSYSSITFNAVILQRDTCNCTVNGNRGVKRPGQPCEVRNCEALY